MYFIFFVRFGAENIPSFFWFRPGRVRCGWWRMRKISNVCSGCCQKNLAVQINRADLILLALICSACAPSASLLSCNTEFIRCSKCSVSSSFILRSSIRSIWFSRRSGSEVECECDGGGVYGVVCGVWYVMCDVWCVVRGVVCDVWCVVRWCGGVWRWWEMWFRRCARWGEMSRGGGNGRVCAKKGARTSNHELIYTRSHHLTHHTHTCVELHLWHTHWKHLSDQTFFAATTRSRPIAAYFSLSAWSFRLSISSVRCVSACRISWACCRLKQNGAMYVALNRHDPLCNRVYESNILV